MNQFKLQIFVIFTLLICSCNNQQQKEKKINESDKEKILENLNLPYSTIEVYCWGFKSNSAFTVDDCIPTGGRTAPSELINDKILIESITDKDTINLLKNMIFGNKKDLGPARSCETRFLMLFKKNELEADTVVYGGTDVLCFNDKLLFNYTFKIMDSIRYFLNKEEISCDCEPKIIKGL